ncbi:hypothetical protein BC628DRAFT_1356597 [Trametes gibbosa]|nr:hypothetical protein BC628DRAFT_1356597 [Trametes gibbosa]
MCSCPLPPLSSAPASASSPAPPFGRGPRGRRTYAVRTRRQLLRSSQRSHLRWRCSAGRSLPTLPIEEEEVLQTRERKEEEKTNAAACGPSPSGCGVQEHAPLPPPPPPAQRAGTGRCSVHGSQVGLPPSPQPRARGDSHAAGAPSVPDQDLSFSTRVFCLSVDVVRRTQADARIRALCVCVCARARVLRVRRAAVAGKVERWKATLKFVRCSVDVDVV